METLFQQVVFLSWNNAVYHILIFGAALLPDRGRSQSAIYSCSSENGTDHHDCFAVMVVIFYFVAEKSAPCKEIYTFCPKV